MEATAAVGDHFIVDELLDFSNHDAVANDDPTAGNSISTDSSALDTCRSSSPPAPATEFASRTFSDSHFSGDLCVPCDDLAELENLEWLSNFVEDSFSTEDLPKLHLISGMPSALKARPENSPENSFHQPDPHRPVTPPNPVFPRDTTSSLPGKARSKRSRGAPATWASRLLLLSHDPARPEPPKPGKKKSGSGQESEVRRCLHCATDKTPQWRTGPMGPKTLCNACGVRYKSGRLVPEYRPAASPTFVLTKHSNSHRKVMELRRQKELLQQQQQMIHNLNPSDSTDSMVFDPMNSDEYLIHQQIGPDFRQLI